MRGAAGWFVSVLFLCAVADVAGQPFSVQQIKEIFPQSLNSTTSHTWWITDKDVEPSLVSRALLKAADSGLESGLVSQGWLPAMVPGAAPDVRGFPRDSMRAWYAKTFYLESDAPASLAFHLGLIDDSDICYLNGVRIGSSGDIAAKGATAYDKERIYLIPDGVVRRGGVNVILINVRGIFHGTWGFWQGRTEIGPARLLLSRYYRLLYTELLFLASYFTVGSYFLFLFLRRRAEIENLLFGVFVYILVCYGILKSQVRFEVGLDFLTGKRLEYLFLYGIVPSFYLFIRSSFKFDRTRWVRIADVIGFVSSAALAACAATVLLSNDAIFWWDVNKNVGQPLWAPLIIEILGILVVQARRSNRDAFYMLGGFAVITVGMMVDIASNRSYINLPPLMSYVFLAFVMSLALILANRFVRLNKEVEDLNTNLEKKVEHRTNQLKESLTQVQALKEQQDGDYFLTSLLLSPLSGQHARSERVNLQFYVKQSKAFSFKRWNASIGGDICVAHTLTLCGRSHVVFLNGDAMGKSMQGAGGALVLGTVFKAMVTRTQSTEAARNLHPEQWLKQCFHELQSVFVAFDGTMLISAVLGIIDEQRGILYYVNAEHPQPVLFRGGRATFLGEPGWLHKIGVEWNVERPLRVHLFQLEPDDVVIAGSDGRDDLDLGVDETGTRIINEDETLFLRAVESSEGDLTRLKEGLLRTGRLTDDLSLIRIGYREDAAVLERREHPELRDLMKEGRELVEQGSVEEARFKFAYILERYPGSTGALRALVRLNLRAGRYAEAAKHAERYLELRPLDTEFLYLAACAGKASAKDSRDEGSLRAAAALGERCRLREPEHVNNLLNLADIYRLLGNPERSHKLLSEAEKHPGGDRAAAEKLRALLQS
ncbi:MAG: SpoIIE family protein phosphatase [Spirochaetia bacterium]|nr:SpoIIE family protein phosphatase [Spirochaetia bacterium]